MLQQNFLSISFVNFLVVIVHLSILFVVIASDVIEPCNLLSMLLLVSAMSIYNTARAIPTVYGHVVQVSRSASECLSEAYGGLHYCFLRHNTVSKNTKASGYFIYKLT